MKCEVQSMDFGVRWSVEYRIRNMNFSKKECGIWNILEYREGL